MNCIKCSACCKVFGVYELTEFDMRRVSRKLTRKSHLYEMGGVMKTRGFRCVALTKKGCSIYKNRPAVCRRFEVDSIECRMAKKRFEDRKCQRTKNIVRNARKG